MSLIVGRQPILDVNGVTYGYELLYRGDADHAFDTLHEDEATSHVINNSFYNTEFGSITSGKKSFINFTTQLILDEMWRVLPKQQVVIEFLENIVPTAEIIAAAKDIKNQGYVLALDDFEYTKALEPLIDLADIIKVDFTISDTHTVEQLAKTYIPQGKILLAEKVETLREFKTSRDWGYTLFQGYFFAEPEILESRRIPESKASKLQLMQKIHKQDIDYGELVDILKTDPGLTMKLLKYINSVSMGIRHEITNLRQALALIGLNNFKKWATILIMAALSEDKPRELIKLSLSRGRFCELLSREIGLEDQSSEYFLAGIFSLMDTAFNQPMELLVADLPLSDEITETLLGNETKMQKVLQLAYKLELNDSIDEHITNLFIRISPSRILTINRDAVIWADQVLNL